MMLVPDMTLVPLSASALTYCTTSASDTLAAMPAAAMGIAGRCETLFVA